MQYRQSLRASRPSREPRPNTRKILLSASILFGIITAIAFGLNTANATSTSTTATGNMSPACESVDVAKRLIAFDYFHVYVNDQEVNIANRDMSSQIKSGDTVRVTARVKNTTANPCAGTMLAISVFESTAAHFIPADAPKQKLNARQSVIMEAGQTYNLSVQVPNCYYQIDINTGGPFKPGDYTLSKRGRLLQVATGGTKSCTVKPSTTTTTTRPSTTTTTSTTTTSTTTTTVPRQPQNTCDDGMVCCPVNDCNTKKQHDASATVEKFCTDDFSGIEITFKNDGDFSEQYNIRVIRDSSDTAKQNSVTVASKKTSSKRYTFKELGIEPQTTAKVVVSTGSQGEVESFPLKNDCEEAAPPVTATAEQSCDVKNTTSSSDSSDGIQLSLTNSGSAASKKIEVWADGKAVSGSPITVAAQRTYKKFIPTNSNDSVHIVVAEQDGQTIFDDTIQVKCRTAPEPASTNNNTCNCVSNTTENRTVVKQVVRTEAYGNDTTPAPATTKRRLADTGFNATSMSVLGGFLLAIGGVALHTARRLRNEYASY